MKFTGRTFFFFWMLVALVLAGSAQIGAQGQDVRVVSTASHQWNEDMPVLKAGRFNVPEEVVARGTYLRIEGKVK